MRKISFRKVSNAVWYLVEGNYLEAFNSLIAALPGIGSFITAPNWGGRLFKFSKEAAEAINKGCRVISNINTFVTSNYGIYVSGKQIITNIKDGKGITLESMFQLGANVIASEVSARALDAELNIWYLKESFQGWKRRQKYFITIWLTIFCRWGRLKYC